MKILPVIAANQTLKVGVYDDASGGKILQFPTEFRSLPENATIIGEVKGFNGKGELTINTHLGDVVVKTNSKVSPDSKVEITVVLQDKRSKDLVLHIVVVDGRQTAKYNKGEGFGGAITGDCAFVNDGFKLRSSEQTMQQQMTQGISEQDIVSIDTKYQPRILDLMVKTSHFIDVPKELLEQLTSLLSCDVVKLRDTIHEISSGSRTYDVKENTALQYSLKLGSAFTAQLVFPEQSAKDAIAATLAQKQGKIAIIDNKIYLDSEILYEDNVNGYKQVTIRTALGDFAVRNFYDVFNFDKEETRHVVLQLSKEDHVDNGYSRINRDVSNSSLAILSPKSSGNTSIVEIIQIFRQVVSELNELQVQFDGIKRSNLGDFKVTLPNLQNSQPSSFIQHQASIVRELGEIDIGFISQLVSFVQKQRGVSDAAMKFVDDKREFKGDERNVSHNISGVEIFSDLINSVREINTQNAKWLFFMLPISDGATIHDVKLFVKKEGNKGQVVEDEDSNSENPGNYSKRFILELFPDALGKIWIDCLFTQNKINKRLDVIMRSDSIIEPEVKFEMVTIFKNVKEYTGLKGELTFKVSETNFANYLISEWQNGTNSTQPREY
ncbi:hypothetical protein MIDIC_230107 [Alphaproteobacteria bacterium]